jgi:hypothetical protein
MTSRGRSWALGVSATLTGTILCLLILAWVGHFEATAETARSAEETAELTARLVTVVEGLSHYHRVEDAGLEKVAELCLAGKLKDCDDCAEAGIELGRCVD